jgi:type IV pilus assembly protein PilE
MKQLNTSNILGVTLPELLIVITIISILMALGYPNYIKFQYQTRRADAETMILNIHSTLQNYLIANNSIVLQASDLSTLFPSLPIASKGGYYGVNVTINLPNYTITATATGTQTNDLNCNTISMDNNGNKSSLNSGGSPSTGCW